MNSRIDDGPNPGYFRDRRKRTIASRELLLAKNENADAHEYAWLLEWPATVYNPVRWYAADHSQPVLDVNLATRFSRREDAHKCGLALGLRPARETNHADPNTCRPVEHAWWTGDFA